MTGSERDLERRRPAAVGAAAPALMLACAYVLLLAAWMLASPPFSALDEGAHYLRALGLGQGQLVGEPAPFDRTGDLLPAQYDWLDGHTRVVNIPAGRAAYGTECDAIQRLGPASCLYEVESPNEEAFPAKTYVGSYAPLPYLLPGVAAVHLSDHWQRSLYLGRAASVLVVALFLAVAVLLLYGGDRGPLSLAGIVVGLTPMTLFVGSALNPSGLEVAASAALLAALFRISRPGGDPSRWPWIAAGVSAFSLALSRQTGPVWLVADLILFVALAGPRHALRLVRAGGRPAMFAVGGAVAGLAVNRLWESLYQPSLTISLSPFFQGIGEGLRALPHVIRENVGIFGSLAVPMPFLAYATWWAVFLILACAAWMLGPKHHRWLLAGLFVAVLAAPVLFHAAAYRHSGFGLQGRYFLPFLIAVPLLAGEIVYRSRARLEILHARWVVAAAATGAAAVHFVSWYWAAHRAAVGVDGPVMFAGQAAWAPPTGWELPALLALAGCALMVATPVLATAGQRARRPRRVAAIPAVPEKAGSR